MRPFLLMQMAMLMACSEPPAMVRGQQKLAVISTMQHDLLVAMEAEKSAVLATTDEESIAFAAAWKNADGAVARGQSEVRRLVEVDARPSEKAALAKFDEAWAALVAIDSKLLELAVANTNLKAARLAATDGAGAVNQLVDALTELQTATKDPAVLRELSNAAISALRIQALLPTHIASADEPEMNRLEDQVRTLVTTVDGALQRGPKTIPAAARDRATQAWARYQQVNTEIIRLSRLNTNVRSFDISVHEKRDAMIAAQNALAALKTAVQDVPRATR